ncbi:MAG: hypothetical protein KA796_10915 [Chryseobacterium sp.]|nr:hypothetical protein [Chryseobacterium sp.]MBP7500356.1 hypothetical protein [Chryseobacterium sp.]
MYKLKDETNFEEIVKKISEENDISKSSVEEMLIFNANSEVSDKLGIKLSELDAVLSGEPILHCLKN